MQVEIHRMWGIMGIWKHRIRSAQTALLLFVLAFLGESAHVFTLNNYGQLRKLRAGDHPGFLTLIISWDQSWRVLLLALQGTPKVSYFELGVMAPACLLSASKDEEGGLPWAPVSLGSRMKLNLKIKSKQNEPGVVGHICHLDTWEVEAEISGVQGYP